MFFSKNIPICILYFSPNYIATTSVRKMNEYDQKFLYSLTALLYQKALIKSNGLIQETSDLWALLVESKVLEILIRETVAEYLQMGTVYWVSAGKVGGVQNHITCLIGISEALKIIDLGPWGVAITKLPGVLGEYSLYCCAKYQSVKSLIAVGLHELDDKLYFRWQRICLWWHKKTSGSFLQALVLEITASFPLHVCSNVQRHDCTNVECHFRKRYMVEFGMVSKEKEHRQLTSLIFLLDLPWQFSKRGESASYREEGLSSSADTGLGSERVSVTDSK